MAPLLFLLICFHTLLVYAEISDQDGVTDFQKCPAHDVIKLRGITLRVENDSFAKTDRDYSHGMAISAESQDIKNYLQPECLPLLIRLHSKLSKILTPNFWVSSEKTVKSHSVVVKLGQSIFTPGDSTARDLILNDRPYAGLIYAGISQHQRYKIPQMDLEILDTSEITFGIIGPWSFAKEFQDAVHDLIGDERFQGWGHQLNNEPALQVALDKKIKGYSGDEYTTSDFSYDFINFLGLKLGNIETSANLGIEGRIGWNLPNDFGGFTIRPGTESRSPAVRPTNNTASSPTSPPRSGIYLFSILELKLVGYDFSLDGNLFSSSHHVTRQPLVTLSAIGLSFPTIMKQHSYNLTIMNVYQSSEFKERPSHHAYRSIGLSIDF